jgi:NAD(P)-dependent dehydrogenase (short-subunit alcohol dehydrogenase family)
VEYIMDLRTATGNELITAEEVDLTSLHSVRKFATKWIDNAPPRRLDMVILCANSQRPSGAREALTGDGVGQDWQLNYLANFHLLSILSPALRAQPADRDVRVLIGTCASYMGGAYPVNSLDDNDIYEITGKKSKKDSKAKSSTPSTYKNPRHSALGSTYSNSKLSLMAFAQSFQKHLSAYSRPDKQPNNARVLLVDPGWTRTPGMQRFLTFGSLWGLLLYVLLYPVWWTILKSPLQGAQSFLYAAMEAGFATEEGGVLVKECREVKIMRADVFDEYVQKELWSDTERVIQQAEKEGAQRRANEKVQSQKEGTETKQKQREESSAASTKKPGSRRSKKAE